MYRPCLALSLALVLSVTGCLSVPLGSLVELNRIDFPTTDLAVLRVGIRLPEAIKPRSDGVRMEAVTTIGDEPERKTTFLLVPAQESSAQAGLPTAEPVGFTTSFYRLSDADRQRFETLRAELMQAKRAGKHGSLGLGIAATEFCRLRAPPVGPLPTTTYLLTSETKRYVVVTEGYDLRQDRDIAKDLADLTSC
jgi:hypothetical protein